MTVKQIRAFLAVAQSLSFAVACERLHLSQSALSLTIKALEEGLGGRLFTRNTRNVALTAEGEITGAAGASPDRRLGQCRG